MEASVLRHHGVDGLRGPTPLLRLQSDERLVALTRRGNQSAYEALVARYQSRLLAFCRHMLGSREDAEDVLQEVFAAAYNAMVADDRPLNLRPWLYRIARNRSLNHLRRVQAVGVDSMDHHLSEHGTTTADKVHRREEFRQLMEDVRDLPETQRTALLLREIDALSYDQIAEAMETTVPSVKSLLVRARVSLAEAAEARKLSCDEVRLELGEVAEGLRELSAPARRHLRGCERCSAFRKELRRTKRALAAVLPVGPLLVLKKLLVAHAGAGGAAAAASSAGAGSATSAAASVIASKAAATVAAAAIVTSAAVEVEQVRERSAKRAVPAAVVAAPAAPAATAPPQVVASMPQDDAPAAAPVRERPATADEPRADAAAEDEPPAAPAAAAAVPAEEEPAPEDPAAQPSAAAAAGTMTPGPPQTGSSTATLPAQGPVGEAPGNGGAAAPPEERPHDEPAEPQGQPAPSEPQGQPAGAEPQPEAGGPSQPAPADEPEPQREPEPDDGTPPVLLAPAAALGAAVLRAAAR